MKKIFTYFLVFIAFFAIKTSAYAFSTVSTNNETGDVTIAGDQTINDNVATAGNNVIIKGTINDDLYVAGANITIDGEVKGTLFAAGNMVTINGKVDKDALIAGNVININSSSSIARDLFTAGNTITVDGKVGRDLYTTGAQVSLNNEINGNVKAAIGAINLGDQAKVKGQLSYTNDKELTINHKEAIEGGVNFNQVSDTTTATNNFKQQATNWLMSLLQFLLVSLIFVLIIPKWLDHLSENIKNNFWKNLGIGFLVLIVAPVLAIICLITVVGAPLMFIIAGLYIFFLYLAKFWVAYYLGKLIGKNKYSPILTMVIGVIILQVLFIIPIIGSLASFITVLVGLGSIYTSNILKSAK